MWYNTGMSQILPSSGVYINGKRIELSGATFNPFDFLNERTYVLYSRTSLFSYDALLLFRFIWLQCVLSYHVLCCFIYLTQFLAISTLSYFTFSFCFIVLFFGRIVSLLFCFISNYSICEVSLLRLFFLCFHILFPNLFIFSSFNFEWELSPLIWTN